MGAAEVIAFEEIRARKQWNTLRGHNQSHAPVMRVHNDYTEKSAPQRVRDLLPASAQAFLRYRYVFINVWRPITEPVIDAPLALCDAACFNDDDLIMSDIIYKDCVLEIAYVRYNPKHRWYSFSHLRREEVVLIKCYDTARDGRARISLHSAFVDPTAPANAKPRQSIEVRTIAFYDK
jgi:hypothetical protein